MGYKKITILCSLIVVAYLDLPKALESMWESGIIS